MLTILMVRWVNGSLTHGTCYTHPNHLDLKLKLCSSLLWFYFPLTFSLAQVFYFFSNIAFPLIQNIVEIFDQITDLFLYQVCCRVVLLKFIDTYFQISNTYIIVMCFTPHSLDICTSM